jgi:hypothetical protein
MVPEEGITSWFQPIPSRLMRSTKTPYIRGFLAKLDLIESHAVSLNRTSSGGIVGGIETE